MIRRAVAAVVFALVAAYGASGAWLPEPPPAMPAESGGSAPAF